MQQGWLQHKWFAMILQWPGVDENYSAESRMNRLRTDGDAAGAPA